MLDLLRRDPTLRTLPRWIVAAPLTASVAEGVRTLVTGIDAWKPDSSLLSRPLVDLALLALVIWLPLAVFLAFGKIGERCTRMDLTLPVPARKLWLAHMLGVVGSGIVVLVGAAAVVALRDAAVGRLLEGAPLPATGVSTVFLPALAALILAATVLQSRDLGVYCTRSTPVSVVTLLGTYALILALEILHPAFLALPLALAAGIGMRTYRCVPSTFTLLPREAGDTTESATSTRTAADATALNRRGRSFVGLTVLRAVTTGEVRGLVVVPHGNALLAALGMPMLFFWGLLISGLIGGDETWAMMFLITPYLMLAFLPGPMTRLHFFDPLPISRAGLFAVLVLPLMLVLVTGYGVGKIGMTRRAMPLIEYTSNYSDLYPPYPTDTPMVRVPLEYCGVAWDGHPPPIDAPWGEVHEPWERRLYRGSRAVAYSRFSTPEGSSAEFVALQISRAVEAIYGTTILPEEISERYLDVDDDGNAVPRFGGALKLLDDFPRLRARRVQVFPFLFSGMMLLFFVMFSIYLRSFRATVSEGRRKGILFAILFTVLGLHLAYFVASITLTRPWVISGVSQIWMKRLTALVPGGAPTTWMLCALLFLAGYLFALSRFRRIEIPLPTSPS